MEIREDEKLVNKLKNIIKLNDYEAKAYLTLLRLGEAKPVEISRASGVPTGRIYDVLRNLAYKGLITKTHNGYKPLPPREALDKLAVELLLKAEQTADMIRDLGTELEKILGEKENREEIRYVYGIDKSVLEAVKTIEKCNTGIIYFTVYKALEKIEEIWPLLQTIISKTNKNIRIIVAPGLKPQRKHVELLVANNIEVREHECILYDSLVACDTVLIGLPSKAHEVVTAYIKQEEFSKGIREKLEEQWLQAKIPPWYMP